MFVQMLRIHEGAEPQAVGWPRRDCLGSAVLLGVRKSGFVPSLAPSGGLSASLTPNGYPSPFLPCAAPPERALPAFGADLLILPVVHFHGYLCCGCC